MSSFSTGAYTKFPKGKDLGEPPSHILRIITYERKGVLDNCDPQCQNAGTLSSKQHSNGHHVVAHTTPKHLSAHTNTLTLTLSFSYSHSHTFECSHAMRK